MFVISFDNCIMSTNYLLTRTFILCIFLGVCNENFPLTQLITITHWLRHVIAVHR